MFVSKLGFKFKGKKRVFDLKQVHFNKVVKVVVETHGVTVRKNEMKFFKSCANETFF